MLTLHRTPQPVVNKISTVKPNAVVISTIRKCSVLDVFATKSSTGFVIVIFRERNEIKNVFTENARKQPFDGSALNFQKNRNIVILFRRQINHSFRIFVFIIMVWWNKYVWYFIEIVMICWISDKFNTYLWWRSVFLQNLNTISNATCAPLGYFFWMEAVIPLFEP